MSKTEKITINMNVVDLGKVDLLVDQGFYSNRTDFIRTSIRNQLTVHAKEVEQVITDKKYFIGVALYRKKDLMEVVEGNKKLDIVHIGLLSLADDIDEELALKAINSIKILGVFRAKNGLKKALASRIRS